MVIDMVRAGMSKAEAARKAGVSSRTVLNWYKLWQENGNVPKAKKPPGRDSKISLTNLRRIKRALEENPFLTAVDIRREIESLHNVSVDTVKRAIQNTLRFYYRRSVKKPMLTARMMEDH